MFHAGKALGNLDNRFLGNLAPYCADGSQIVLDIVDARDFDFLHVQDWGDAVAVCHGQGAVLSKVTAQLRGDFATEL